MLSYVIQRIGQSLITVLIVTMIIFVAVRVVGDPAHLMLPPEATEADRQVFREQLGLADPIVVQYGRFLANLARGDMGQSYRFSRPAMELVWDRAGATFLLTSFALGFGVLVGIPLGVASAVKQDTWIDQSAKFFAVLGQAAPPFLFALMFVRFFSVELGWLPTSGYGSPVHLILPTIALGWYSAAGLMRLTRSNMLDVLHSEYIKMARIKGVPEAGVVYKHALRNASLPVITFAALQFGILMGGAVSVEAVFAWPGMGSLILDSISNLDFTIVQAAVTFLALIFTAINLIVDIIYAFVDPRIRYAS
ncbi:MAG: ABC transporter permease [Burkholderiales bacterium]|nr:ABC transporter permease [Burkholderiales bacterium]